MKIRPVMALVISFASWFAIGIFLLYKGLSLLMELTPSAAPARVLDMLSGVAGGRQQAILLCICLGLFVGFMKGRFVLSKTVQRLATRFYSYNAPMSLKQMYPISYLALIGCMVLLGMSMKWLPIAQEIRGTLDVAIGSALTNGAFQYLRHAFSKNREVRS